MTSRLFAFAGGTTGRWRVLCMNTLAGEPLAGVDAIDIIDLQGSDADRAPGQRWVLRGITSNERYVTRDEKNRLAEQQQGLGRPFATCAALIPLRKSASWWALTQDERRQIFEEHSRHIAIGMNYLPAIARRLHHCRDLGSDEPFDFITWFEFAEADTAAFDDLLKALRASPEWRFVDREVDIRLRLA